MNDRSTFASTAFAAAPAAFDAERALAREDLCRFLAACHYEPDVTFAEERLFESLHAAAARLDPAFADGARRLGEAFAADDPQTLLVDYARLFLGPQHPLATPYGCCWLSGEAALMNERTQAVVELYRQGGLDVDDDLGEPPDHIAIELEFLYLLIAAHNRARMRGDDAALATTAALHERFLAEHLGAWIAPFSAAVRAGAQTAFYRELADLTERFVRGEAVEAPPTCAG